MDEQEVDRIAEALRDEFEQYAVNHRGHMPLSTRWPELPDGRKKKWRALARRAVKEVLIGEVEQ